VVVMKGWKMVAAAAVLCSTLAWSRPAAAESYYENAGWGVLTVLTNVVYMPAKITYAALGGLTGGLALGLTGGDMQVAENVWTASLGGTYVVTPRMLRGEDPIAFAGSPGGDTSADANAPAIPDSPSPGLQEQNLGNS
jgi:hypothetical protein